MVRRSACRGHHGRVSCDARRLRTALGIGLAALRELYEDNLVRLSGGEKVGRVAYSIPEKNEANLYTVNLTVGLRFIVRARRTAAQLSFAP